MSSNLTDVTTTLLAAVEALGAGKSIRSPEFSLQDASLALELFDEKLDSGFHSAPSRPLSQQLPATALFGMVPAEAIKIADKLLQLEVRRDLLYVPLCLAY